MFSFLKTYFSVDKKADRFDKKIQNAILANNQQKLLSVFSASFGFLLKENKPKRLSNLILTYESKIDNINLLSNKVSSDYLKKAVCLLDEHRLDPAALKLCDYFEFSAEAIDILAKRGRVNDLTERFVKDNVVDKELLQAAIMSWEKYNGDIRKSPTLCDVIKKIAVYSIESIPENPRAWEIIEHFKEAAILYHKEKDLSDAARCYEQAKIYYEACKIYEEVGDKEGVSRTAESLGDYEKALKYVVKPERKVNLLIRMENFIEAREFSAGLESPIKYLDLIRESAKKLLEVKIKSQDFIGAMELTDIAECNVSERENVLLLGRKSIERKIASAKSEEDIQSVYRDRVKLEEKAGHFEEAGRIAEEVLKDLNLASLLYEKANLYNYAIHAASEHFEQKKDKNEAKIRLAELHEKGGNILSAANLYESAGFYDKAYQLYETTEQFDKAIECYLKLPDYNQNVLMQLYNSAGAFDKIVEIYLKSETYPDLEKALSIAKAHSLDHYIQIIQGKIGKLLSGSKDDLIRCFNKPCSCIKKC